MMKTVLVVGVAMREKFHLLKIFVSLNLILWLLIRQQAIDSLVVNNDNGHKLKLSEQYQSLHIGIVSIIA